jgi:rRNA maturation endonuclease Nob1
MLVNNVLMSDAPKSALELAMERLKKKDADAGIEHKALTDEQKQQIAEARSVYEARVAERRIMHQSKTVSVFDPQELEVLHEELRRDLAQFESDRDARIRRIKGE